MLRWSLPCCPKWSRIDAKHGDHFLQADPVVIRRAEFNVVPAMFLGVSYSQGTGGTWPKMSCISNSAKREIML